MQTHVLAQGGIRIKTIVQFAYKDGPAPDVPTVDCRRIENPWSKAKTPEGRRALVRQDPEFGPKVEIACELFRRGYPIVAIGCTHGRDRSGAVAEEVARLTGARILTRREYESGKA